MDLREYDDLIKHLVAIAAKQDTINDDLRAMLRQQTTINRRLEASTHQQNLTNAQNTALIMRISRTLDLIDEKLERIFPPA